MTSAHSIAVVAYVDAALSETPFVAGDAGVFDGVAPEERAGVEDGVGGMGAPSPTGATGSGEGGGWSRTAAGAPASPSCEQRTVTLKLPNNTPSLGAQVSRSSTREFTSEAQVLVSKIEKTANDPSAAQSIR
jgi:hypothetical protein